MYVCVLECTVNNNPYIACVYTHVQTNLYKNLNRYLITPPMAGCSLLTASLILSNLSCGSSLPKLTMIIIIIIIIIIGIINTYVHTLQTHSTSRKGKEGSLIL